MSAYYWPEPSGNAPYVTGLTKHLVSMGHEVTVLTGFPHYPEWRARGRRLWRSGDYDGVRLCRRFHSVPRARSARSRGVYEGLLLAGGLVALPRINSPDAVLGICPTLADGVLAAAAARVHAKPFGLVFQDVLSKAASQGGVSGGPSVATLVRGAEGAIARRANVIGVVADGFRSHFEQLGVLPDRIHRLRNWVCESPPSDERSTTRARLGWRDQEFICLHAGNMGSKQDLVTLIAAAEYLRGRTIRIVLAGEGSDKNRLRSLVRTRGLSAEVSFLGNQEPGAFESMLAAADVLLINQRASVRDMSLPSKLTSYFASGRPVVGLVAVGSETERELLLSGGAIVLSAGDSAGLAEQLLRLAASPALVANLGRCGHDFAESVLSPRAALPAWERLVASLASKDTSSTLSSGTPLGHD